MAAHPATGALAEFWVKRAPSRQMRLSTALEPGGGRVGGRQEDALVGLIEDELVRAGLDRSTIRRDEAIALPGAYNPAPRRWDLLVVEDDVPVAAVSFTAAAGPSFGKNFNNRVEQILGDAVNLGRPYEPEALTAFRPCLALCFVFEDCERSTIPVRPRPGHIGDESGFPEEASYKDRYGSSSSGSSRTAGTTPSATWRSHLRTSPL